MDFFSQPLEVKKRHMHHVGDDEFDTANNGYTAVEQERYSHEWVMSVAVMLVWQCSVDPLTPGDLKEGFQVTTMESNVCQRILPLLIKQLAIQLDWIC